MKGENSLLANIKKYDKHIGKTICYFIKANKINATL